MRQEDLLSRRETAALADLSLKAVDKAVEQKVIKSRRGPSRQLFIPSSEVGALALFKLLEVKVSTKLKREIRDWIVPALAGQTRASELALAPVLVVRIDPEVEKAWQQAMEYTQARSDYIERDPETKGGEPVIRGTRLTTRAVTARLERGDTMAELAEDYPYIPREALEAAAIYGRTHPRQGRPPRPPRPQ
jgi:uncharacterized protein (DUF433 family)